MEEIDAIVKNVFNGSFSVVVAAFLLLRMEKELRLLRESIEALRHCSICRYTTAKKDAA